MTTYDEAALLADRLFAAFPDRRPSEEVAATKSIYVEHLQRFHDYDAARAVVRAFEEGGAYMPRISELRDAYTRYRQQHPQAALPEPPLTLQEREENIRRARALGEMVEGHISMEEALREVATERGDGGAGEMQVVRDGDEQ